MPKRARTRDEAQLADTLRSFRVVRARPGEIVARRGRRRVVFRQIEPHRAAVLFRHGQLDEAPVPLGDIRAALLDPTVGRAVHVTHLNAVDSLVPLDLSARIRQILDVTADRRDYALLVPEELDAAAPSPPAREFRAARADIEHLPRTPVRIKVEGDVTLRYGASLLIASWRDLGLDVQISNHDPNALFVRRAKPDAIAIAHAVDARFVSPRVRNWHESADGVVDYAEIRLASTP